ncbi:CEP43-like protein [Mya arenaria]|uniref:CEP43-like protein n=1 Tax=Mya arenaria TaxID=6604 RepID=A0ABY7EKQ7_MYAAR|nr:CEP43-like protein [Mya arenaria]
MIRRRVNYTIWKSKHWSAISPQCKHLFSPIPSRGEEYISKGVKYDEYDLGLLDSEHVAEVWDHAQINEEPNLLHSSSRCQIGDRPHGLLLTLAQLRASVFLALEEQETVQNKTPFLNQDLKKFLSTKEGSTVVELVREFLDYFSLEFTQAVFEPESGVAQTFEGRASLAKELNVTDGGGQKQPLLLEVLKRAQGGKTVTSRPTGLQELSQKQLTDARKKFDYYDREFVGMYKRLFLQCRGIVSGDVADILSPTSPNKSLSSPVSKASNSESLVDSRNRRNLENGGKHLIHENNNTDTEEDFFDDPLPTSPGYKSFTSDDKGKVSPTGGQKTGPAGKGQTSGATHDGSDNLRSMDKRMAELGLDGDGQDYSYEDDFQSEGHSLSQKSPRMRSEANQENGSIAEEIEEDIDELSIEGDEFIRSEKSAFDDMTTDRTISQVETGN